MIPETCGPKLIEVCPFGSTNYSLIIEITAVLLCTQCKIENRPGLRRRLSFCPTQSHLQQANPIHRRSGLGFAIAALPLVVVDELIGDPRYGDPNTDGSPRSEVFMTSCARPASRRDSCSSRRPYWVVYVKRRHDAPVTADISISCRWLGKVIRHDLHLSERANTQVLDCARFEYSGYPLLLACCLRCL